VKYIACGYERGETAINANTLLKYANFFDVSADYILCRCNDPQGMKFDYQPEYSKNKLANSAEWREVTRPNEQTKRAWQRNLTE
jgi:transcriptional regulator with XRE-family HTH domain